MGFKNKEAEKAYGAKYRAENAAREKERPTSYYLEVCMRSLNLDQLVPWVYVMPTPEQKALERAQALEQAKRHQLARMPTEEMLERLHERHATRRADLAWLKANMPIGTTFDHLGARCMVVGIFLSDGLINKQWVAEVDMETAKGIRRTMLPVPVIRAYVELGFVA